MESRSQNTQGTQDRSSVLPIRNNTTSEAGVAFNDDNAPTMSPESTTVVKQDANTKRKFDSSDESEEDEDEDEELYAGPLKSRKQLIYERNCNRFARLLEGKFDSDTDESEEDDDTDDEDEDAAEEGAEEERLHQQNLTKFAEQYPSIATDANSIWDHYNLDKEPHLDTTKEFVCAVISRAWEGSEEARWHIEGRPGPPHDNIREAQMEKRASGVSECYKTQAHMNWKSHTTGRKNVIHISMPSPMELDRKAREASRPLTLQDCPKLADTPMDWAQSMLRIANRSRSRGSE